jgi:hypothetical protein
VELPAPAAEHAFWQGNIVQVHMHVFGEDSTRFVFAVV